MRTYILQKYSLATLLSAFCLLASVLSFGQSSNENYVQSKTCLNDDCSRRSETITYFDGLGRAKQIVSVKSTPTGKDLVTPVTYDGFGRQIKDILPVPAPTQNSSIHMGIIDESAANTYYGVTNAYAEKQLENSPLDRLLQQAAPGEAWKMSSGKTRKFTYDANLGTEVKKFVTTTTTSTANNVYTAVSTLSVASANSGFYPASTLYKNTLTDEDGNPVTEFKNGQGQTILIRRNDGSQHVDTYYVYNEYNQLAFVLSPKAVKQIELGNNVITDEILNELCYQYKYDGRSRLVEKKIPGKDWEFMVYDRQDRIVLTQDGKLRTTDNSFANRGWLFTKYDELGRVAYTGFYPNTAPRPFIQNQVNNLTASSPNTEIRITNPTTLSGTNLYYRNQAFPSSGITLLTVSYYDTYPSEAPAVPATVLGQPTMSQTLGSADDASTTGMVTSSYVKNIEDNNWTKAYHYYDSMGRQVAVKTTNHLGGYTNTETELDFAGVAKLSKTYHKRLNGDTEKVITETFEYDNQNRLLVHKHKVDNNPEEILAQNTYNDLSQLTNKKVGGTVASSPLQSIDYAYNIRGWMTKINDPKNLGNKLFGYEIKYNTVEGLETPNLDYTGLKVKPKYNGNIAEVDWRTGTTSGDYLRRYGYVYDSLNRLSAGFYQKDSNPSAKEYFEKMDYDLNGNITNLKRSADSQQGAAAFNIDELAYAYANNNISNRLTSVTDSSTDYRGYPDTSGIAIPYDVNGNMLSQKDKGMLQIDYNFLDLPYYIKFDRSLSNRSGRIYENTNYLYRADGRKVRKTFNYAPPNPLGTVTQLSSIVTEYLDGFQYESTATGKKGSMALVLKFVPTAEGYYNFENNKYIYNYTDHLGNVRLSYFNNGSSLEVLEENNYYPFGMKHEGYNGLAGNSSYQYKYNGKELQTESGMYDYGARFYIADIGRWGVVDPAAELGRRFSPYNYAFDNPIMFVDPDGMWPWPTWSQVKNFASGYAKGAWSTAGSMVKGAATSTYTGITGGVREAKRVYNAYQTGGAKAAAKQYMNSVYETSGAKAIVQTAKGVAKGDAESIGSAAVIVAAAAFTHKAGGGTKTAAATEKSITSLEGSQLSRSQMSTVMGDGTRVPSDANVVRGGTCLACQFENGSGVTLDSKGLLSGVSVNSVSGLTIEELSTGIANGKVGTTTVADIEALGGQVEASPTKNNPNHATMSGITADQAEKLFNPTIKNPTK